MLNVNRLIWDSWNVAHIARHDVTPDEVEEACHGDPVVLESYGGRLVLVGPTMAGKLLAAVFAPEGEDTYYVVTARSASRKERRYYQAQKGGATQ
jgi:uncharacterized protein